MPKRKKRNSIFKMAAGLAFAAFSGVVLLSGPPPYGKEAPPDKEATVPSAGRTP